MPSRRRENSMNVVIQVHGHVSQQVATTLKEPCPLHLSTTVQSGGNSISGCTIWYHYPMVSNSMVAIRSVYFIGYPHLWKHQIREDNGKPKVSGQKCLCLTDNEKPGRQFPDAWFLQGPMVTNPKRRLPVGNVPKMMPICASWVLTRSHVSWGTN